MQIQFAIHHWFPNCVLWHMRHCQTQPGVVQNLQKYYSLWASPSPTPKYHIGGMAARGW